MPAAPLPALLALLLALPALAVRPAAEEDLDDMLLATAPPCPVVEKPFQAFQLANEIARLKTAGQELPQRAKDFLVAAGVLESDLGMPAKNLKNILQGAAKNQAYKAKLLEVQAALFPEVLESAPECLAIFDFDQTLSAQHLEGALHDVTKLWGGKDRTTRIVNEVLAPLKSKGCKVVVLTRNSGATVGDKIRESADFFFAQDQSRKEALTPDLVIGNENSEKYGDSKSCAVQTLILPKYEGPVPESNILFADDDPKNIEDMELRFPGAYMVKVCEGVEDRSKDCHGMGDKEFHAVSGFMVPVPQAPGGDDGRGADFGDLGAAGGDADGLDPMLPKVNPSVMPDSIANTELKTEASVDRRKREDRSGESPFNGGQVHYNDVMKQTVEDMAQS